MRKKHPTHFQHIKEACVGTATVGVKGQIVIPAKAREKLKLKEGDQLIVCVRHDKAMILIKSEIIDSFIDEMQAKFNQHIKTLKSFKKKNK